MRAIRIGNTFLFPANVISFSQASRSTWGGAPAEEGVLVTTLSGASLEFFGPGLWEAFQDWAASECDGPVDAKPPDPA